MNVPPPPPAGQCKPGTNQSLNYCFPDSSLWIKLTTSDIIYGVYAFKLASISQYFNDLLELGTQTSKSEPAKAEALGSGKQGEGNGQALESPLILQGTEAAFEAFLECVFGKFANLYRKPALFWLHAIEMADFLGSTSVMSTATHHLSLAKDLDPADRLQLAIHYHLDEWLPTAFRELLKIPLALLTQDQIHKIGFSAYITLAETHTKIAEHRAISALVAPPVVHDVDCKRPEMCKKAWAHAWWGEANKTGVAIALIHPHHMPAHRILNALPDISVSWQMPGTCRKLTVKALENNPNVLLREDFIIAGAVKVLKGL
ncbi:hypothetical protein R3P38DRAFT_2552427 [Favolaschia claudopus]|uniref:BTB domain-containing protein n=1 Tax=Favolaschia claudopus TaxID=2862362 RepID=A0AAW0AHM0_9AGAR